MQSSAPTSRPVLSSDTCRSGEQFQIEVWRSLSSVQVAALVSGAFRAVQTMALAGLRTRYPKASAHELSVRLAAITLGPSLAKRVYPELEHLNP